MHIKIKLYDMCSKPNFLDVVRFLCLKEDFERVKFLRSFSTNHPIVLLLYYVSVMLVTIFYIHPIVLTISFFKFI